MAELLSGTYVLEKMVSLFIGDRWQQGKAKIKEVYAKKNGMHHIVTFESMMYTALIDCFCAYCGKNPNKLSESEIQYFFDIADGYLTQVRKKIGHSDEILLKTLDNLSSKYNVTWLEITTEEKISLFDNLLFIYLSQHESLRTLYNLKTQSTIIERTTTCIDLLENMAEQIAMCRMDYVSGVNNIMQFLKDLKNEIATIFALRNEPIIQQDSSPFSNNVKGDYITKWNNRLFLHKQLDDQNLTLENTYTAPPYKNISPVEDEILHNNLNERLDSFVKTGKSLLLIGPPGIGKTSVVCFLANKYKDDPNVIILRFSDWENYEWPVIKDKVRGSALGIAVLERLNCKKIDLNNKILILDGYDELNHNDKYLLEAFFMFIEGLKNFRIIITSRENYIKNSFNLFQYVIKLQPFNMEIIPRYVKKISKSKQYNFENKNLIIDEEVLGIPVILYMAITTGIDITIQQNRYSIYEKIFSLNGGIFDRFAMAFLEGYEEGSHVIRYKKKAFSTILCNTAFRMFEKDNRKLSFEEYKGIIAKEDINFINSPLWLDFPIDNLFDKSRTVEFVHKSIYEYYAAEYIYRKFLTIFDKAYYLSSLNNEEFEELGNEICEVISTNIFSDEICEFLSHKINSSEFHVDTYYKFIIALCKRILNIGPIYFVKKFKLKELIDSNSRIKNINHIENNLLVNIMHIIHLWDFIMQKNNSMFLNIRSDFILNYFRVLNPVMYNFNINLSHMNLSNGVVATPTEELVLNYIDLTGANLLYSFLSLIRFSHVNLSYCDFSNTSISSIKVLKSEAKWLKLEGANLAFVNFKKSNFYNAIFSKAFLRHTQFEECNFTEANFQNTMMEKEVKIISSILDRADLSNGVFERVDFTSSHFKGAIFSGGKFEGAKFHKANLDGADLRGGIFTNADFRTANISTAIYNHELDDAIL